MTNQAFHAKNRKQAEMLIELGEQLRQFRLQQGLALETIASKTLIPTRLLQAIEDGNLAQLPEPVYIQGFIRRYAEAMGMDGIQFASAFPADAVVRSPRGGTWRGNLSFQAQLRPVHLYVLYTLVVVSAVGGLSYLLNRSVAQPGRYTNLLQVPSSAMGPTVATNGAAAKTGLASKTQASSQTAATSKTNQKPVRVGVTLVAQSWMRVEIDGEMVFEGVLSEGTQRQWEGNRQVTVRAGNAGGIMVSHNDNQPKRLGSPGAVEEVVFKADSAAATESRLSTATAPSGEL